MFRNNFSFLVAFFSFVLLVPLQINAANLPGEFDLRNVNGKNMLPPVRNQVQEDACTAFAVALAAETTVRMAHPDQPAVKFSEAGFYFCDRLKKSSAESKNSKNNGDSPLGALIAVSIWGFYLEKDFPFVTIRQPDGNVTFDVNKGKCPTLATKQRAPYKFGYMPMIITIRRQAKRWIMQKGGLVGAFKTTPDLAAQRTKMANVYRAKRRFFPPTWDHVVVLVGWNDTKNAWLIQNSWGNTWNGDGYAWVGYDTISIFGGFWLK